MSDNERKSDEEGEISAGHSDDAEGAHEGEVDHEDAVEGAAEAGADGASAKRVAAALGLEDDAEGAEATTDATAEGEAEAPANRAGRRRDEAVARRRQRRGKEAKPTEEELPKDRNARAKELLKRRQEQVAEAAPATLDAGEMVDDALARSASAASKWLKKNVGAIQWVILAGVLGAGGYVFYSTQTQKKSAAETDALYAGVLAERGRVLAEDKRSDEEKEFDPTRVYKTVEERTEAALAGYRKAESEFPNTISATLAKLGEAGALLDKRDWDGALLAYGGVVGSKVAAGDADVKGRALEGIAFAKEGKGDLDGALASFREMQSIDARGFKELGMYQEARVLLAKGDTDKAKELLKQVKEKLSAPNAEGKTSSPYLEEVVNETLRKIDPSLAPPKSSSIGGPKGGAMTKEEIEKYIRQMKEGAQKKGEEH